MSKPDDTRTRGLESTPGRARRETVRMPCEFRVGIQQLVDAEVFDSKSECIRAAVRELLVAHDALATPVDGTAARSQPTDQEGDADE